MKTFKEIREETVKEAKKIQDIARKYKRELQKAVKTGQLELSDKATRELERWAVDAGEIRGKEEDEFIDWLDKNLDDLASGKLREGRYTANDGGAFDGLRIDKNLDDLASGKLREGYYSDKDKKQKATLKKHDKRMINKSRDSIKKYEKGSKEETEVEEGRYTANDGGAFDGLRIAKYLAHEDGKSWRKLKYGDTDSYLRAAADLLKQDKAKAKSILAKPTPRD
jgi:hypothetical protein